METNVSDTPETDDFFCNPPENWAAYEFGKKLERQRDFANARADQAELRMMRAKRERDKAWHTLAEIRKLFKDDASFGAVVDALFAKPLETAQAEIERLKSLENV